MSNCTGKAAEWKSMDVDPSTFAMDILGLLEKMSTVGLLLLLFRIFMFYVFILIKLFIFWQVTEQKLYQGTN